MGVRIVTDSTADLPEVVRREYGIEMVPLYVHFGDEVFRDQVELSSDDFFARLAGEKKQLPHTSQPSPGDFADLYRRLTAGGDTVVSIHISDALSGTLQSARTARELLDGADIRLVDSRLVSACLGQVVVACAEAARAGASADETVALAESLCRRTNLFGAIDTLEYLERGGRIGRAQALLGSLLNMKPIVTLSGGVVAPAGRVRGKSRVIPELVRLFTEAVAGRTADVTLVYGARPDGVDELERALQATGCVGELSRTQLGPVVGTHAGPGVLGLAFTIREPSP
ncbi:MAG TPA: DegV family protein [Bacillota bacterium]